MSNFPGGYDPYNPDGYPAPRQSSGCMRGCVIAGIILLVLALIVGGAIWWFVNQIQKGVTDDPVEVERRLRERFPTADLPEGFVGRMGLRVRLFFEMDVMVFAKGELDVEDGKIGEGAALILLSAKVPGNQQADINLENISQGGKVVEKRKMKFEVDDHYFDAFWQRVETQKGRTITQLQVPLDENLIVVMQDSGDEVDEKALRHFLRSIAKDCPARKRLQAAPDDEPEKGEAPAATPPTATKGDDRPKKDDD